MSIAPQIATGVPNPAAPSMKAPKGEADEEELDPPVRGEVGDAVLHHLELPGADGDVVDEDRVEHDPADGHESEGRPVERRGDRHRPRHLVDEEGDEERRGEAEEGRDVGLHVEEGQRSQQHDDG